MNGSQGCSRALARAGAATFALAYALTLPVSLLAFAWGNVLFSADEMSDIMAAELVESGVLQQLAVEALLERGGGEDRGDGALDFLGRQDLDQLFAIAIPPGWARLQIHTNLENLYHWIDDQRLLPQIQLDIRPIKAQLIGGGAERLVEAIVSTWPACGAEQIEAMARQGFSEGMPEVLCRPPEPLRSSVVSAAVATIERQVQALPDTVQPGRDAPPDASQQDILRLKRGLRLLRGLAQVGWLLPISALGLITALAVRSWPQLLRWWGVAILAGGLATFLAMFISGGVIESALASGPIAELPLISFEPVLRSLVDRLSDASMGRLFVLAFFTTAVGVAMLVAGLWIGRRTPRTYSIPR